MEKFIIGKKLECLPVSSITRFSVDSSRSENVFNVLAWCEDNFASVVVSECSCTDDIINFYVDYACFLQNDRFIFSTFIDNDDFDILKE